MKLILGTVQFGLDYGINNKTGKPSSVKVHELLDFAYQHGIKVLDSAEAYGNVHEIIGDYHKSRDVRFSINTKFKISSRSLSEQVTSILNSLYIDQINCLYYHNVNDFLSNPQLSVELQKLVEEKKINHIGLSIYSNEEFQYAISCEYIKVIQLPFNLLDNFNQRGELLEKAKSERKEIHARSIFLQGLFFMPLNMVPTKLSPLKEYLRIIHQALKQTDITMEQLCIAYVQSIQQIDNIIIGVDNCDQLLHNIANCQTKLSPDLLSKVHEINVRAIDLLYPKNWNL